MALFEYTALRNRIRAGRYLVPDVCVFWPRDPREEIPEIKPHIVIEVPSPSDSLVDVLAKLQEYLDAGIPHVWLLSPREQAFLVFGPHGLCRTPVLSIPEVGVELQPADLFGL